MGCFKEEITLTNVADKLLVKDGARKEARQIKVKALVDTGAITLIINKTTCQELGLEIEGTRISRVADGRRVEASVTSPVHIRWKDRETVCSARMLHGAKNTLLGAIPLEDMDLMIDMEHQCLVGVHGDQPVDEIC